uniref:Beta-1,3-N-acetylglucosaminyltransferase radical fringe-like n=1 Tax=Sinocyclocheilus grahami TaxID=75366 RepID=A0A672P8R9_SINGR
MHLSHVGTNKICFLLSLAFCALLVLLIPSLQPLQRQKDLPQPRPRTRPAGAGRRHDLYRNPGQGSDDDKDGSFIHPLPPRGQPEDPQRMLEGDAAHARSPGSRSKDSLDLRDIFIAVKTTRKYHKSRLQLLSQTWSIILPSTRGKTPNTFFLILLTMDATIFNIILNRLGNEAVVSCVLFCRWFCHMDDDNYVILPSLLELLSSYSHTQDVYLGRPSLDHPIEAAERVKSDGSFWFATGGAGFCISRGLALKMSPWASLGNFITTAEKIRLPDDCTVGYIIEALLEVPLTHTGLFHSHLENLQRLPTDNILQQVTLSYGGFENRRNVVSVGGAFSLAEDPTRFKTVHCLLYPDTEWCPHKTRH